jgi:hypothetical protein
MSRTTDLELVLNCPTIQHAVGPVGGGAEGLPYLRCGVAQAVGPGRGAGGRVHNVLLCLVDDDVSAFRVCKVWG